MKLFGYRASRINEWIGVLRAEDVGALQLVGMVCRAAWMLISRRTACRGEIKRRVRRCNCCVLYNSSTHTCRGPGKYSHLGCGCYIPFKAKFTPRGEPCFLDEEHGGWRTSE